EDHAVEPEIGHLRNDAPVALPAEGRRHHLGRLLADLPADLRLAALEERRGVGAGRTLYLARLEHALHHLEEGRTRPRRGRRRASRSPGEEAGPRARVAGDAVLVHLEQSRGAIWVVRGAVGVLGVFG